MITPTAQQSFSLIFNHSVKETLHQSHTLDQWEVNDLLSVDSIKAKEFIVLTMCSYGFRLFTTLHFTYDRRTLELVSKILKIDQENVKRDTFYDYLSEYGNIYCGTFKRALGKVYPHLGMSTPDILNEHSFSFFENLKYQFGLYKEVTSQNQVRLYFGLYVCPYVELDFEAPNSFKEIKVKGELEIF